MSMQDKRFFIVFNGCKCWDLGLRIIKRPNIAFPKLKIEPVEILGRDGTLTRDYGTYEDLEIPIEFNFIDKSDFSSKCRIIKKWINNINDNKLQMSDDLDYFYKVKYCRLEMVNRVYKNIGKFTLIFVCEPYMYSMLGQHEIDISTEHTIYNDGYIAKPIYIINGNGLVKLKVNNKEVSIQLAGEVKIDSELRLCYREDEINNTVLKGRYEDLWFKEYSENIITWEGNITSIRIIPNIRSL